MSNRPVIAVLALAALLAGCTKDVDVDSYTCGDFQKSFRDKDDTSAGNYIRQLSKRVKAQGRSKDALEQQMGAAVAIACGRRPASYRPAGAAVALVDRAGSRPEQDGTSTAP